MEFYIAEFSNVDSKYWEELVSKIDPISCIAIEDGSFEEEEIDEILGKDAYCGGNIPESVLERLELETQKSNKKIVFRSEQDRNLFLKNCSIEYKVYEVEKDDWNKKWRKGYKKIVIDNSLAIIPSWEKKENKKEEVYIYPGQGFGTGDHETTFLCLKLYKEISKHLNKEDSCLDFGCGSGILGIAVLKQKNIPVDFCDIDADALDNCVKNYELNWTTDMPSDNEVVLRDRFSAKKKYKLVFANILENVLESEKPILISSLSNDGYLIVSGILSSQLESTKKIFESLSIVNTIEKNGWAAICFLKK